MNSKELNRVFIPKSDLLKKYVQSFNVYNYREAPDGKVRYYAFPQSGTEIIFFNQARLELLRSEINISRDVNSTPLVAYLGKYLSPIRVSYDGFVQKIAIHFTETGIVNFFPDYYSTLGKKDFQCQPLHQLDLDASRLFSSVIEDGLKYLENYLLKILDPVGLPAIEKAAALFKQDTSITTEAMARQIGMNLKTFGRQFKRHVGCTTSEYKRITKFKKAARNYFDGSHKNLLELCHKNGYYDASDFNRQIRRSTALSPKQFFQNIKKIGPKNRIYIFE